MRILVSGSTGFLGTALVDTLQREGHTIARLVRPGPAANDPAAALFGIRRAGRMPHFGARCEAKP